MKFETIRLEGAIFTEDILERIAAGDIKGQLPGDFKWPQPGKVKDKIALAWGRVQHIWKTFTERLGELPAGDPAPFETEHHWVTPLLYELGFRLQAAPLLEEVNNRVYAISHREKTLGGFPVNMVGFGLSLDQKGDTHGEGEFSRVIMSPHGVVQEYLNLTEHLFALVTNGKVLRLLRDSSRLVKLSFIEFDLESMLEREHYADFALLYRLLHISRLPVQPEAGASSWLEVYHQDSVESGARIRLGLSEAVKKAIGYLAGGFLAHPHNTGLRQAIEAGTVGAPEFYAGLLRLIYRLLFLMVIEERRLVFPGGVGLEQQRVYELYYSIGQLRRRCESLAFRQDGHHDLWRQVKATFSLFEEDIHGQHLGIRALAGDLFGCEALGLLPGCDLANRVLLEALRQLSLFQNRDTRQLVRVNYGSLNVEEFGSVYEGLLEYRPQFKGKGAGLVFDFSPGGDERSRTGSHYTPDVLVFPLIKHALEHQIEGRLAAAGAVYGHLTEREARARALLSLRVCDVACGSGHILLNAARRIGTEVARVRTGEEQPAEAALKAGIRDAINHCIYGVDKNPLAVELCKVALWLEAHSPGEPLNFLDHRIKCGDAIVGVAQQEELQSPIPDSAFTPFGEDNKGLAAELKKLNKKERMGNLVPLNVGKLVGDPLRDILAAYREFERMPEQTAQQIVDKKLKYHALSSGGQRGKVQRLADVRTAQFFVAKTEENEGRLVTQGRFAQFLATLSEREDQPSFPFYQEVVEQRFFHWFLEFPEVFAAGGFDCILGNPPFLGGLKISTHYGPNYLNYLLEHYAPAGGPCDLVAYFFRRIFTILKPNGFQSLIATNTIAQGATREGGLEYICENGGVITHAVRSMRWPGLAAVEVAMVTIYKGKWEKEFILDQKVVKNLSYYLDDQEPQENPFVLSQNTNKSFIGSYVLGNGFVLSTEEATNLIERNNRNKDIIWPFINGDDSNSRPDQSPSRWVINFFDWPEAKCRSEYPECFEIVERLVKPERDKLNRKIRRERWWIFAERAPKLYNTIAQLERFMIINRYSKIPLFSLTTKGMVFSDSIIVIALDSLAAYAILNSELHIQWAWKYGSTMGGCTLRYTPSDCFETFPFPQGLSAAQEQELETLGETYHEYRRQLLLDLQLGLTKTYNQFHNPRLRPLTEPIPAFPEVEKSLGKESATLWNHLAKTPGTCAYNDAVARIVQLRHYHQQMDQAVLKAYGWTDIPLAHDFYDIEYLPENDRVRFTISPTARQEILHRLLLLNHQLHLQEPQKPSTTPAKTKPTPHTSQRQFEF